MTKSLLPTDPRRVPVWVTEVGIMAVILFPAMPLMPPGPPRPGDSAVGIVATLLPAAFLWLRHRFPITVLAATLTLYCTAAFTHRFTLASAVAMAVAMYALAAVSPRKRTIIAVLGVILITVPVTMIAAGNGPFELQSVQLVAAVGLGAALGDSSRSRRAYIAEITARAVNAEAARESETARRVSEERLRIARDLHDVVAHQISVISLGAGLASSSLRSDPERAGEALAGIRAAVRQVLGDIGDLLSVLRSDEDLPRAPQPGLEQIPDLCDDFARSGLKVEVRFEGEAPALSPTTDLIAFRVLQEALTNALKHGSEKEARVTITTGSAIGTSSGADTEGVSMLITNPTTGSGVEEDPPSGHGLQGMRERVASVRGRVTSDCEGGVFRVHVELPSAKSGAGAAEGATAGAAESARGGAEA